MFKVTDDNDLNTCFNEGVAYALGLNVEIHLERAKKYLQAVKKYKNAGYLGDCAHALLILIDPKEGDCFTWDRDAKNLLEETPIKRGFKFLFVSDKESKTTEENLKPAISFSLLGDIYYYLFYSVENPNSEYLVDARKCYNKVRDMDCSYTMLQLGVISEFEDKDDTTAIVLYTDSADKGCVSAMRRLGDLLYVANNIDGAIAYYKKAEGLNDLVADLALACHYHQQIEQEGYSEELLIDYIKICTRCTYLTNGISCRHVGIFAAKREHNDMQHKIKTLLPADISLDVYEAVKDFETTWNKAYPYKDMRIKPCF